MRWDGTFKYEPLNDSKVNQILTEYSGQPVLDYIKELYRLIEYQRDLINKQEKQIIAFKHHEAWKHYDKPIENYDPKIRKYVDKPPKSGNMSC
jgi:flagellar biosynthesis chaperone FliJ